MMKIKFALTVLALLNLAACAIGPTEHEIYYECRLEMDAARTAVQLRDKGRDKMTMLRTLPPIHKDSTRLLRQMYQIVDETYASPHLNDVVYGIYRYEYCARQLRHEAVPVKLQSVQPQLRACQAHFGRQASRAAIDCVRAIFSATPKQTPDKKMIPTKST